MRKSIVVISLLALLCAAVLVCGCLGVTMHTTVDNAGKITEVSTELNMSQTNYDLLTSLVQLSSPGMDMKTYFVTNYSKSYSGTGTTVDYSERESNGYVYVTLDARGPDIQAADGNMTVTKDGDDWVFRYNVSSAENSTGASAGEDNLTGSLANAVTMDFYLTMPGKILDSNADVVNGNKAEWHYNADRLEGVQAFYAKSDVSSGTSASPGFGPALALLAIAAGVFLVAARKRS